jgi:hypothetical protein
VLKKNMKWIACNPDQYTVRNNWLHFPGLGLEPVQIPFGLSLQRVPVTKVRGDSGKSRRPRLRLRARRARIHAIEAQVGRTWRKLLPVFSCTVRTPGTQGPVIRVEAAVTEEERAAAKIIAARGHYLSVSHRGLILIARIDNTNYVHRTRAAWWRGLSPQARKQLGGAMRRLSDGVGNIVGALHIDRLLHGDPAGRNDVRKRQGKRPNSPAARRSLGYRSRTVRQLGLYWVSRVTVDAPFQRIGIGSILCDAAREVVFQRTLESGRYIELIRHMSIDEFNAVRSGKSDFLTGCSEKFGVKLPFTLRDPYLSRKPMRASRTAFGRWSVSPSQRGLRARREHCLAYYYAKAGPMVIRSGSRHR